MSAEAARFFWRAAMWLLFLGGIVWYSHGMGYMQGQRSAWEEHRVFLERLR